MTLGKVSDDDIVLNCKIVRDGTDPQCITLTSFEVIDSDVSLTREAS